MRGLHHIHHTTPTYLYCK